MLKILTQLNWLDILIILFVLRLIYVAANNGMVIEGFKFLGVLLALYLSFHYYASLAVLLQERLGINFISLEVLYFLTFLLLATMGYCLLIFLRRLFSQLIKIETVPTLSRWGGLVLGIIRGMLGISLILFMLVLSNIDYFRRSVSSSLFARHVAIIAPYTYRGIWEGLVSKFMSGEEFNQKVSEVQEGLKK